VDEEATTSQHTPGFMSATCMSQQQITRKMGGDETHGGGEE